ncbi:MAG: hypothetical protein AAFS12_09375 [Cyanobacteria bacterium J06632_19]
MLPTTFTNALLSNTLLSLEKYLIKNGHWELGMGHRALGIGHWGWGIGHWAFGIGHWASEDAEGVESY